jgi:hypothetical protein
MHEDAQRTFQDLSACLEPLRWVYQNSMLGPRNLSHLPVSPHSLSSFKNRSIFFASVTGQASWVSGCTYVLSKSNPTRGSSEFSH